MAGLQYLTYFQIGVESVAGTSVAATRQLFPDGTGFLDQDLMLTLHEDANRGFKTNTVHATSQGVAVELKFKTAPKTGLGFDEAVIFGSQLRGSITGSGAQADKTWQHQPNQTGASNPESFTIEVGDPTQEYEVEYCHLREFTISAERDGMTQAEGTWFGRQVTKSTKTSVSSNSGVKIPGYLWTLKHATAQSGLGAASVESNFLRSFSLTVDTGLRPHFYLDGNAYFGQVQEGNVTAKLSMVVDSTSSAVTYYYDKWQAQTVHFARLGATGPALGGSNYLLRYDVAVIYTNVEPIGRETNGVNQYNVEAALVYDSTWTQSILQTTVNTITALP